MKRFLTWRAGLAFIILLVIALFLNVKLNKKGASSVTYKTGTVTRGTLVLSVSGTGNLVSTNSVKINPPVSGIVQNLAVKTGDKVTEGQALFSIKNDQTDVTISKSYGSYIAAKQSAANATVGLLQAQQTLANLQADSKSTASQIQIANQQVYVAQLNINTANQNLNSSWLDYSYQVSLGNQRTVTAPITGTITTLGVGNGDQLGGSGATASTTAPVVIQDLSNFTVSVQVNEVDAPSVKAGQKVSMTFDAISGLTSTGVVTSIDSVGTATQGVVTYNVYVSFDSVDGRLRPGMTVTAVITTQVKQDVLLVPNSAIKGTGSNTYIETLENGKPVQHTIVVGSANDASTEVVSGLTENESIITQTITASKTTSSASSGNLLGAGGGGSRSLTSGGGAVRIGN